MSSISILSVCISAFVLIFLLLSVLAVAMSLLTRLITPAETDDGAVFAAISMAYKSVYPDKQVVDIKEIT